MDLLGGGSLLRIPPQVCLSPYLGATPAAALLPAKAIAQHLAMGQNPGYRQ